MKPTIVTKMLSALLLAVILISCDDKSDNKEPHPLTFEKDSYEVGLTREIPIQVRSGNRDYSLSVDNPNILDAKVDLSSPIGMGDIRVKGKQKGETILSVKDNLTKETVKLNIKVIDNYLSLKVEQSNHPALTQDVIIFLINNEEHSCYFVSVEKNQAHEVIATGKYKFSVEEDIEHKIPYLTLTYASDDKGRFTDAATADATIAPTSHQFDISGNGSTAYELLAKFFNFDWEKLAKEQSDNSLRSEPVFTLNMKEVGTKYEIQTIFRYRSIPEGILE